MCGVCGVCGGLGVCVGGLCVCVFVWCVWGDGCVGGGWVCMHMCVSVCACLYLYLCVGGVCVLVGRQTGCSDDGYY